MFPPQESQPIILGKEEYTVHRRRKWLGIFLFLLLLCGGAWVSYVFAQAPTRFTPDTLIEIPEGYTLQQIGKLLESESVIRSPLYFNILVAHYGKEKGVPAGAYLFKEPLPVWSVARRLALGDHGIETRKITLPEGLTNKEMADVIAKQIPDFDVEAFLSDSRASEGYLFPDTYFFFTTATSGEITSALQENFLKKTAALYQESLTQKRNWSDTVIMASILEEEAATAEDRRIVSGILWKRLAKGMPLQVDATFAYTMGKGSLELTLDDLKSDSPYNTYRYKGLPPTPIANPGLDAIASALEPTSTPYLFYLSGKDGAMHYAKTFEEHKINKAKYLR